MSSVVRTAVIKDAAEAWKFLNGIVCVYKPKNKSLRAINRLMKQKLCADLNELAPLPRQEIVQFRRVANEITGGQSIQGEKVIAEIPDGKGKVEIIKTLSYADHPLVAGPGYTNKDIRIGFASLLGFDSSGLSVIGINDGCRTAELIPYHKWLRSYTVSGEFGKATDTFFHTGRILQKARYYSIRKHMIDRMLASSQAQHQRFAFEAAGIPLTSERAYELASQGLVRPEGRTNPIIYSLKCTKFEPPHFDIEMCCVNESEAYIREFIHDLGLRLRSLAVCTKIRCTKFGPFELDLALLEKHWTLEHILSNMNQTSKILKNFKLYERDPLISKAY